MDRDADIFQALGDPIRLRLLNLLAQAGAICVCELVDALQVPQYNISRHLHILANSGWVDDHRLGKWVYYRIAKDLRPYQRALLRAIERLGEERGDFQQDEARASRRFKLRRKGLCCVGLASKKVAAGDRPSQGPRGDEADTAWALQVKRHRQPPKERI